ncbi:uncharacterized protein LOC113215059, partial [Frankliniella occidentalis]|uniref:Uncharacterized protein LOC113215059 n=1 Tax=Frankliniella occidentalis TaxID=133901 RepID=A0A9C6X9S5_FRAOC
MARKCAWCGEAFSDGEVLLRHIEERHAPPSTSVAGKDQQSETVLRRKKKSGGKVQCDKCGKSMLRSSLRGHLQHVHRTQDIKCDTCGGTFNRVYELRMHKRVGRCGSRISMLKQKRKGVECKSLQCPKCRVAFKTIAKLTRHKLRKHPQPHARYVCVHCRKTFRSVGMRARHVLGCDKRRQRVDRYQRLRSRFMSGAAAVQEDTEESAWETRTAVQGNARIHLLHITHQDDLQMTCISNKSEISKVLKKDMQDLKRIKWYMTAHMKIQEGEKQAVGDSDIRYMRCAPIIILREDEVEDSVKQGIQGVLLSFENSSQEGSNILYERVEKIEVRVCKYAAIRGSSYLPLPNWLKNSRKGLINIQNFDDEKCFKYCIVAGINLPQRHPERVAHYRGNRGVPINMQGIKYPVRVTQISKFEGQNRNIAVSVFGLEEEKHIVPLRISKVPDRPHHIRMLLITSEEGESHYVLITDLSKLLGHSHNHHARLYYCDNCLTPMQSRVRRDEHQVRCLHFEAQAVRLPSEEDNILKFRNYGHQALHDYVIYCDLESMVVPYDTVLPDPQRSATSKTHVHKTCGFCYIVVGKDGKLVKEPVLQHGGDDVAKRLLMCLKEEERNIMENLRGVDWPLDMTEASEKAFQEATHCYMCNDPVPRQGVPKCRDHDHQIEVDNYRGCACSRCNLNLKRKQFIPVYFHCMSRYDIHFLISAIGELSDGTDLSCIPRTKERYVAVTWGNLRILDTFNFLSSPLEKLVADLKKEDLTLLIEMYPDEEKRELLSRKGVYPYSYFQEESTFLEKKLPPKECFKNDLTGEHISDEDYSHAQNVFKTFNMENLWDFHDAYLLSDVLLLGSTFETYRRSTMKHFKLDCAYYYSGPGLSWDAALLFTGQELSLITDIDIHEMVEQTVRGGVSIITHRLMEFNNPRLPNFDPSKEITWGLYADANNLYGLSLARNNPVSGFRFLTRQEINELDVMKIEENDSQGYILEVDLSYPPSLHKEHDAFCLAPEHYIPQYEELSPLQKRMIRMYNLPKKCNRKLIPNLKDKSKYCVYGETLKLYVSLGLKITHVHRVIKFEQKAWLAPYIMYNTEMRKKATSSFEKSLWKLYNNSVFGKTMESVRKRRNVDFTKQNAKFLKLVRSPLFHSFEIFDNDLVAVERRKGCVKLDRPIAIGAVVLDTSKAWMYNCYYNVLKKKFGSNVVSLLSDTDAWILSIKTEDLYKDLEELKAHFDFSDYPPENVLYSTENKKVMGKFKDELNGAVLAGVVGLRPKMYSFKTGDMMKCVAKGVPRSAVKNQLNYDDYKDCILKLKQKSVTFSRICTDQKHHVFTAFSTKRALSCYDDKRYISSNNKDTYAFGSVHIAELNEYDDDVSSDDEGAANLEELVDMLDLHVLPHSGDLENYDECETNRLCIVARSPLPWQNMEVAHSAVLVVR